LIIQKVAEELNQQVGYEFYSAYFYLAMSAHSESIGLKGFSHWFMVKYQEEMAHAMKMYQYILSQGARVKFYAYFGIACHGKMLPQNPIEPRQLLGAQKIRSPTA